MNEEGKKHTIINDMIFIFVIYYLTHLNTYTHTWIAWPEKENQRKPREKHFLSRGWNDEQLIM